MSNDNKIEIIQNNNLREELKEKQKSNKIKV